MALSATLFNRPREDRNELSTALALCLKCRSDTLLGKALCGYGCSLQTRRIGRGLRGLIVAAAVWFSRLGDAPGIDYQAPAVIDRRRLPGYDAQPTIQRSGLNRQLHESLWWQYPSGGGSRSPAGQHANELFGDKMPTTELLIRLYEVLELPGVISDYHFAIQGCLQQLWKRRRVEPDVLAHVEALCWIDIRMLEAYPDSLLFTTNDNDAWPRILGFGYLIRLYSRDGHIRSALDVARRAERFEQHQSDRDSLAQRFAAIVEEARE